MIQTLVTFEQDGHSIDYIPPYLTRDIYTLGVDIMGRDWSGRELAQEVALATWCAEFCASHTAADLRDKHAEVLQDLAADMARAAGFRPHMKAGMAQALNAWTGGDEYDPKLDPKACTCLKCTGIDDDDSLCKFKGIHDAVLPILEWSHLAKNPNLLDAPFTLYTISKLKASASANGAAADRQKREREREANKKAKSTRNKYGHNW